MAKFTHLHVHSEYSLLDGLAKIDQLFSRALELGMDAIALTDHGAMYGAVKFYLAAQEYEMKPIIGMEAYLAARSRFDKQADIDSDRYHLLLLAKNDLGYKNLMKLTTLAHLEGFYYKPRIDMEVLRQHAEGLVATSGCIEGIIPTYILEGKGEEAEAKAKEFLEIFGKDFYIELQRHVNLPKQEEANQKLIKVSRKLGIPLVATADLHYVNKEDAEAQDALICVQTQKLISDQNRLRMIETPDLYLRSQEEMIETFKDLPEAIENTQKIARECNLELEVGKWHLPKFDVPPGYTPDSYLRALVEEGLKKRYSEITPEIRQRVDYELSVIISKGYSTYFLIVQDFVNWAKQQGIRVGPGRGSVAGSVVSYALRITSVDPFYFQLPFERFMHPERPSTPDIDLDFADDRRDEVINYVVKKYGLERVAHIVSFGRMEARGAVRDIGRVLGMSYSEPDKIAKLIPFGMNISSALKTVPELDSYFRETKYKKLLDLSQKIEGTARHTSIHAAGLVIGDKALTNYTPLQFDPRARDKRVTQYDMYDLDIDANEKAVGLLKIDLLGLRNLSILERCLEIIKQVRGEKIDLSEIPLDDKETFRSLSERGTIGVFQLETPGMQKNVRLLKPTNIFDLMVMVALYRPGPIQVIPEFIRRKHNPKLIRYTDERLKNILSRSYGLITYQDDVLLIATQLAGYTWAEADKLRHAMSSKKHRPQMARLKNKFVKGCIDNGLTKEAAEELFQRIEPFGAYGFNKSHAACYAMVAYQTAYMKCHWPVEFMAALMTAESASISGPQKDVKMNLAIEECRRMGIKLLPPDINTSKVGFTIEDYPDSVGGKGIRFGLAAIKNVGEAAIGAILSSREVGGDFKSLTDFCQRVDQQKANRKVLESLIKAGAMDKFGKRAALISAIDSIRSKGAAAQKEKENGQESLFTPEDDSQTLLSDALPDIEEFSEAEKLSLEKDLLGFYLTANPLSSALRLLEPQGFAKIFEIYQQEEKGKTVRVGGIVNEVRIVMTKKNGQEMAFAKIEDETGALEVVVFPKTYSKTRHCWLRDRIVVVRGRTEYRQDSLGLIAEDAFLFDPSNPSVFGPATPGESFPSVTAVSYEINLPARIASPLLVKLNKLLKENPGNDAIALVFTDNLGNSRRMLLPFLVDYSPILVKKVKEIIGERK